MTFFETFTEEEVAEEVPEEPQVVEEIPIQAANDEPCEDQPCAMSQLMTVLSATNLNNIIPTNKKEGNFDDNFIYLSCS